MMYGLEKLALPDFEDFAGLSFCRLLRYIYHKMSVAYILARALLFFKKNQKSKN